MLFSALLTVVYWCPQPAQQSHPIIHPALPSGTLGMLITLPAESKNPITNLKQPRHNGNVPFFGWWGMLGVHWSRHSHNSGVFIYQGGIYRWCLGCMHPPPLFMLGLVCTPPPRPLRVGFGSYPSSSAFSHWVGLQPRGGSASSSDCCTPPRLQCHKWQVGDCTWWKFTTYVQYLGHCSILRMIWTVLALGVWSGDVCICLVMFHINTSTPCLFGDFLSWTSTTTFLIEH
jgi:hypothetical protein